FDGDQICSKAFLLIYDVSEWKWKSIHKHFLENDILPITHQLKGKSSNNKISFEIIINILIFISNYANIHGLPSPETKPIIFLPATDSYLSLFRLYNSTISNTSNISISSTSFINIWKLYLPSIKFLSPRSDLCIKCKTMRFNISHIPEAQLEQTINEWTIHNNWAKQEREYYRKNHQLLKEPKNPKKNYQKLLEEFPKAMEIPRLQKETPKSVRRTSKNCQKKCQKYQEFRKDIQKEPPRTSKKTPKNARSTENLERNTKKLPKNAR
ncbi:31201_t:CDS:2, partial [Gigaspora margarita]